MLTRDEFKELQPYEEDFHRAVYAHYKLATLPEENKIVEKIIRKYEPKERVDWSCGNCSLRVYTRVGWMYYQAKEVYGKKKSSKKLQA